MISQILVINRVRVLGSGPHIPTLLLLVDCRLACLGRHPVHRPSRPDVYKTWTRLHGPPLWTRSIDHPMDPVHGPPVWTGSMDHPMDQPTGTEFCRTSNRFSPDLWTVSRQLPSWMRKREGAGESDLIRQPTPSKVRLRLIRKLNTFCALPLKLRGIY